MNRQLGMVRGDFIGLLIAAVMLGGLLIYGSVTGQDLPLWPAMLVAAVNVVAAFYVYRAARKRKNKRATLGQTPPRAAQKTPK
jgi:membrane protein implicated in regulation of membrane protease activity